MFSGSHDHVLDEKGRTSLPKDFRDLLAAAHGDGEPPWLTAFQNCLAIYPADEFQRIRAQLTGRPLDAKLQRVKRLVIGNAIPCTFDKQGRIVIPPSLRRWAGLDRDIVFTGVDNAIEIWDRERHIAELERARDDFFELTSDLDPST